MSRLTVSSSTLATSRTAATTTTTLVSVTATILDAPHPLAARELAHACGAELGWVIRLVETGIVEPPDAQAPPDAWRFRSADLRQALEARRLERDFGVDLDAAALILDLQNEVRRLKTILETRP
jgi:chaperone modulatory protein CbpM